MKSPRTRHAIAPSGPSMTDRGSGAASDINTIVARAQRGQPIATGMQTGRQLFWADVSNFDYTRTLNQITRMNTEFMSLPSEIRARFNNSPQRLLDFLGNEENRSEAEKLGLVPAKAPPEEPIEQKIGKAVAEQLDLVRESKKDKKGE